METASTKRRKTFTLWYRLKRYPRITVLSLGLVLILNACEKTDRYFKVAGLGDIVTDVAGHVTDLNNQPVSKALISAGSNSTITDNAGNFFLENVELDNDAVYVTVIKPGYFPGSRTFSVNPNSINVSGLAGSRTSDRYRNSISYINIRLIPKIVTGSFVASKGGVINVWGGGNVAIGAGSVVNATTGSTYTGNVSVSTFYLNPADAGFNEYMPGDLRGITINNEERILQSFGMLSIEMNDASGEKLQLAAGKTATITLPIPTDLQGGSPATIPLWYFDEHKGIWKEEGTATRQGNSYTGFVTHFSFWNCDLPAKYVKLDAIFINQKGIALANNLVTITSDMFGTRSGYTDSKGTVSGLIPANESLIIKVFDHCREIIYTDNIGPFNTGAQLGTILVANRTNQLSITVKGKVISCNKTAVTDGYIFVSNGINSFNAPIINGNFIITFPVCSGITNPVILIATDNANSLQGETQIININNDNQDLGQISACTFRQ